MKPLVGAGALARLDAALVDRIRRGENLGGLVASAIAAIVIGAGAYGLAFGVWRAPEQALYGAIKLPLLFLATSACTIALSGMLAMLLRARLSLAQTVVCVALSLAITSILLGAMAPIGIWLDLSAPPPDPSALGLDADDPRAVPTMRVAQGLLLTHVFVLACAGTAGVARLRSLLLRLGLEESVAARVMVAWVGLQFLVGSQLSWLMRPFFGRPNLPPSISVDGVLEGSFYEEVAVLARATFGPGAPVAGLAAIAVLALGLASSLRSRGASVTVRREEVGLVVLGGDGRVIPWSSIATARAERSDLRLELTPDAALVREVIVVACPDARAARDLERAIDVERVRTRAGPFRTATS